MKHRVRIVWDPLTLRWRTQCYNCAYDVLWIWWTAALICANEHFKENQEIPF